jgi:tetratricopeptide (TPR) repeat protein
MRFYRVSPAIMVISGLAAFLLIPTLVRAQAGVTVPSTGLNNSTTQMNSTRQIEQVQEQQLGDPRAAKAYGSFMNEKNPQKRIKKGKDFISRFPSDYRAQAVYEQLAQLYNAQNDMTDFYSCSDRGISLYPNDATLLSLSGFVIAHAYKPTDANGAQELAKAESYEKRALSSMDTMKAPASMSADQFKAYTKQVLALAHGALGLIYFRQSKFQDSVTELTAATKNSAAPDATDYLVLGADYQNLSQWKQAADAFHQCAQISGPLQSGCKQYAASSAKQDGTAK